MNVLINTDAHGCQVIAINRSPPLRLGKVSSFLSALPSLSSLSPRSLAVFTDSTKTSSKPARRHAMQDVDSSSSSSDSDNLAGDESVGSDEDLPNVSSLTDEQLAGILGSEVLSFHLHLLLIHSFYFGLFRTRLLFREIRARVPAIKTRVPLRICLTLMMRMLRWCPRGVPAAHHLAPPVLPPLTSLSTLVKKRSSLIQMSANPRLDLPNQVLVALMSLRLSYLFDGRLQNQRYCFFLVF